MLNVAIAVDSASDFGPQAVNVIAAACEEVIGEQHCLVAGDLPPGAVAAWYAVVHPNDPALSSIRVEFRDRTAEGVLIEERLLTFSAPDSAQSRLLSVGTVIAALVAEREGGLVRPYPHRIESTGGPVSSERAAQHGDEAADWGIDFAALVTPGIGNGLNRLGGLAGAHVGLHGYPFGLASGRYAVHPGNPSFSWTTLSAGLGLRRADSSRRLSVEFSSEFVFERTNVTAERSGNHASANQNGWGARIGAAVVWAMWPHATGVFSVDGTLVVPRITVIVGQGDAARLPLVSLGLGIGVRLMP